MIEIIRVGGWDGCIQRVELRQMQKKRERKRRKELWFFFWSIRMNIILHRPFAFVMKSRQMTIKLYERNSSCCWLTFIFECSRKCNNKVSPVLGAIKFYVRNMGHYFFLWFTRGHKVKHLDGATAGCVDNVDRLLARENFEDGAKVCSIFMTLLNFQAVFWSFICCQYSAHFLFSRMSRLISSHSPSLSTQVSSLSGTLMGAIFHWFLRARNIEAVMRAL